MISHIIDAGEEHPIAFASRTLKKSERNYAEIKETLAIIFGQWKFHKYLYERLFHLYPYQKPLVTTLSPKIAVPTLAAVTMQRWTVMLQAYNYHVKYQPSYQTWQC